MERFLRHHIDSAAQEFLKVENEPRWEPRTRGGASVNKQINIAFRTDLTAGDRTKDTHVGRAMLHCDTLNGLAFFLEKLFDRHKHFLGIWATPELIEPLTLAVSSGENVPAFSPSAPLL
jgi:hypothetical protein